MEYYDVNDIIEELKNMGITKNGNGQKIRKNNVCYFKNKLKIKPINADEIHTGRGNKEIFSQEDMYKIVQEIALNGTQPQETEMISYKEIAKTINEHGGRTKNGKKLKTRNIHDYIRRKKGLECVRHRFGNATYVEKDVADEIINSYLNKEKQRQQVIQLNDKNQKMTQLRANYNELKTEYGTLKDKIEKLKKENQELKLENQKLKTERDELQEWKECLEEHKFLGRTYWR